MDTAKKVHAADSAVASLPRPSTVVKVQPRFLHSSLKSGAALIVCGQSRLSIFNLQPVVIPEGIDHQPVAVLQTPGKAAAHRFISRDTDSFQKMAFLVKNLNG